MSEVYSQSYVNLAANAANGSDGGLVFLRDPLTINPCLIGDPRDKSRTKYYYCADNSLWARKVSKSVLSPRAWVLQETLPAPRALNFTSDQLFWECQTMRANEVEPHGLLSSRPSMGLNLSNDFQILVQDHLNL
jgi:hypothetical protein